ncbi:hypothetical protein KKA87_07090 [bacterium]|nr:hypothetical protein [bacterium]
MNFNNLSLILLLLILPMQLLAAVRLPGIFTNNMVIQRNIPFNIWGWAAPAEPVSIKTSWGSTVQTVTAGEDGAWRISIQPPKKGGPYDIKLPAKIRLYWITCYAAMSGFVPANPIWKWE